MTIVDTFEMSFVANPFQRVAAEFVGTTLFIFAVSSSVVIPLAYLQANPGVTSLVTAFIQGLTLVAVVSIFSWVSGSHFNPAITGFSMFTRQMNFILGLFYIAAQCVGAILGAAIFRGVASLWRTGELSAVGIGPGVSVGQAFLLEFMITTILLMVVLATSVDTRQGVYILAPVPIGFSVLIGVLIARTLTGASMNPARALGPAVVSGVWNHQWLYWVAPFASVIFVSVMYYLLFHVRTARGGHVAVVPQATGDQNIPLVSPAVPGTSVASTSASTV